VPNLDLTGWYDHCFSLGHLTGMQRNARTALARTQTKAVVGPWAHHTIGKRECHGIDFGPAAAVDTPDIEIRWFDHWLKGLDNGVDREPAVRYFVIGSGRWQSAPTWPPPGLQERVYYLASGGAAHTTDGSGALRDEPAATRPTTPTATTRAMRSRRSGRPG